MDKVICKECDREFSDAEALHRHLRFHKMAMFTYYHKWEPRYDLYDHSLIRFRDLEQYRSTDFNNRANVAAYYKTVSPEQARATITDYFRRRKERKNLVFSPCQVDLRTLPVPGMKFIEKVMGCSYYDFTKSLGFKNKFDLVDFCGAAEAFPRDVRILVDTREQLPLSFSVPTETTTLTFADYALNDMEMSKHGFIERKSLSDLYGTMTAGFSRFQNELNRAKGAGAYIVVVVEGDFDAAIRYPDTTHGHVRIRPEVIFHRVRVFIQVNPHIQFLFVKNREDASRAIERIFTSRGEYKRLDLQYAYDTGKLV